MIVFNKKNKGFTLVELLVVISIMVVLGVIFTNILIETLRGKNKVNAINQVKQNGQVVLDKLSNEIRSAEKVVCVGRFNEGGLHVLDIGAQGLEPNDTIVVFNNGTYSQFRFIKPYPTGRIPSNGRIQKVAFTRTDLPDGTQDSALCLDQDIKTGSNLRQSLTDMDIKNGVSIDTLNNENIFDQRGDSVIIKFTASAGVRAGYAYDVTVQDGGVPFTTSVQTRGIKR